MEKRTFGERLVSTVTISQVGMPVHHDRVWDTELSSRLAASKRLRAALCGTLPRDMPLAAAADIVARGLCERRDRVYAPGFVRFIRWLRTPLHSTVAERDFRQAMLEIEHAFANDVAIRGVAKASGGA